MSVDQPTANGRRTDSPTLTHLREEAAAMPIHSGEVWPARAEPWMAGAAQFLREMAARREAIGAHAPMGMVRAFEMEAPDSPWTEEMIKAAVMVDASNQRELIDLLRRKAAWMEKLVAREAAETVVETPRPTNPTRALLVQLHPSAALALLTDIEWEFHLNNCIALQTDALRVALREALGPDVVAIVDGVNG